MTLLYRGIVQSVEHQSPKLGVVGSSPPAPAKEKAHRIRGGLFLSFGRARRCEKPRSTAGAAWVAYRAAILHKPLAVCRRVGGLPPSPAPAKKSSFFGTRIFYPSRRLGMESRVSVYGIAQGAWHHRRCIFCGLIPYRLATDSIQCFALIPYTPHGVIWCTSSSPYENS